MTTLAHKPIIHGDRIVLRPMTAADADHLWADVHDDDVLRSTGTHTVFTRDRVDRWCASRAEQTDRLDLAVAGAETGDWLGEVVVNDWDPDNRSCGFRIALSTHARRQGFGTEATRLIVDYVFDVIDDPPVNRLALEVYDFNARARAVYERVGFVHEGVLREALRWNGEFHDAIAMSIVRGDREAGSASPV